MFLRLAYKSLADRKGSVLLTLIAMSVSVFVLFSVEHIRHQARESFSNTVSGIDLIVGSRTGSLNLLLYSVFRVGSPTNNISWSSYKEIRSNPQVKWAIPISLGDSHKGYRVMGTSTDYFKYFSYGNKNKLGFQEGVAFENLFDVVLGAEVAKKLGYGLGDEIILSHGIAATSFSRHDDRPFKIVGILKPTGTPVDQTLHVSLEGIEAIHVDWQNGIKIPGSKITPEQLEELQLTPKSITAFMLGLNSRLATFTVQRSINNFRAEPMMAILPGVALTELWQMMGMLENTLFVVAILVFVSSLFGLSAMLLSSIRDRLREIQLLRVVGAAPSFIFLLVELEAILITIGSIIVGGTILTLCLIGTQELTSSLGLNISYNILSKNTAYFSAAILIATIFVTAIPSLSAHRMARRGIG